MWLSPIPAARAAGWPMADAGTLVVIEGPRFSTRAESQWYAAQGWTLIGMTGHPEAVLARELALCYVPLALVTDTDAGVAEGEGVTQEEVFRAFGRNVARLPDLAGCHLRCGVAQRHVRGNREYLGRHHLLNAGGRRVFAACHSPEKISFGDNAG